MHNALIALAYIAMILLPCFVAQWGHLLQGKYLVRVFMTSAQRALARAEDARLEQELEGPDFGRVFITTRQPPAFAMNASLESARAKQLSAAMSTIAFAHAQQRVAARLAQLTSVREDGTAVDIPVDRSDYRLVDVPVDIAPRIVVAAPPPVMKEVRERPREAAADRHQVSSHTFEGTVMGMVWNSTLQPPALNPNSRIRPDKDTAAETAENSAKAGDLSKAA